MEELKNLKNGLKNFSDRCESLNGESVENLLNLYGNISILIAKSMNRYSNEISYSAQKLQSRIHSEIQRRINRG